MYNIPGHWFLLAHNTWHYKYSSPWDSLSPSPLSWRCRWTNALLCSTSLWRYYDWTMWECRRCHGDGCWLCWCSDNVVVGRGDILEGEDGRCGRWVRGDWGRGWVWWGWSESEGGVKSFHLWIRWANTCIAQEYIVKCYICPVLISSIPCPDFYYLIYPVLLTLPNLFCPTISVSWCPPIYVLIVSVLIISLSWTLTCILTWGRRCCGIDGDTGWGLCSTVISLRLRHRGTGTGWLRCIG